MASFDTIEKPIDTPVVVHPAFNIEDAIRLRAYELYAERGGTEGSAEEDWLRAENDVLAQIRREDHEPPPEAA